MTPFITAGPEHPHVPLEQRWADPPLLAAEADAVDSLKLRPRTREGQAIHWRPPGTVEAVFEVLKTVLGCRPFHLRGLQAVWGEWRLVNLSWNLKRMLVLQQRKLRAQTA